MPLEDSGYAPLGFSRIREKNSRLPHAYLALLLGGYHGALQIRAMPAQQLQQLEVQWLTQGHPGSDRHSETLHPVQGFLLPFRALSAEWSSVGSAARHSSCPGAL